MNCTNHPDQPVAAYCQNCGKALCAACVRPVSSNVYCEQCLAEKLGVGAAPAASANGPAIPQMPGAPNPGLAALLGIIPGVGAMYNGQYVKAIVHVLVFVVLVGLANSHDIFGIFIAAWFFYQVFDAYHTARARRFGLPVPDPFGLNDLGNRLGLHNAAPYVPVNPATGQPAPGAVPPGAVPYDPFYAPQAPPAAAAEEAVPPYGAYPPYTPPYTPVDPGVPFDPSMNAGVPVPPPDLQRARREPIGAIVLIGLGMLFLFNTLGLLQFDWIGRGWPLLIIGIGIWMLISRSRGLVRRTGGGQ
uniref:B box-type domain-containing protein n=1 Tax=Acidobacterium capsulatum TaxID=33075 RepID=A0A7V5CS89_9BACT